MTEPKWIDVPDDEVVAAEQADAAALKQIKAWAKEGGPEGLKKALALGPKHGISQKNIRKLWPEPKVEPEAKAAPPPKGRVYEPAPVAGWSTLRIAPNANELERLTYVPGVVGGMAEWMTRYAKRPNRMMSLAASLCVVGTLIGRRIRGPSDNATHLYLVMLAPTGFGKDDPMKFGAMFMDAAGAGDLLGPGEFASGPGWLRRLMRNPLMVCFVDEFADELMLINGNNGDWVAKTKGALKKCYNSFGIVVTAEKTREESQRIDWPAPSICAAATPQEYFAQYEDADFSSGFANRFMILPFEGHKRPALNLVKVPALPPEIIAALKSLPRQSWSLLDKPVGEEGAGRPELEDVPWGPGAREAFMEFSGKMDNENVDSRCYELAMRVVENAARLATIVAVGRGLRKVEVEDIAWAIALSEHSFEAAVGGVIKYHKKYFEFPQLCDEVDGGLRKAGFISTRDLNRDYGRKQRYFGLLDRVLEQLQKESRIHYEVRLVAGQSSPGYSYVEEKIEEKHEQTRPA